MNDSVTLNFASIELMSEERAALSVIDPITRGCYIEKNSTGVFTDYSIQCDGFECKGCIEVEGISRDVGDFRPSQLIQYNILMDDVLLSPDAWATQGFGESITGTATLNASSLLVIVRSLTTVGSFYMKCFKDGAIFGGDTFFTMIDNWSNYDVNDVNYSTVIKQLSSSDTTDVVAAFNVLQTMKDEGRYILYTIRILCFFI